MKRLTITRPDDWHLHLRDGGVLRDVVAATAQCFARAIVMPNLSPPVTTTGDALAYRTRILDALEDGLEFEPLMTLYLTEQTSAEEIASAAQSGKVHGVKLYPAGATTGSAAGVRDLERCYTTLEAMQRHGMPLLVHGEVVDASVDVFDREMVFIERVLAPLVERFPALRVVLEHITTRESVDYVTQASATVAATITPHHLLLNRNALFSGGLRPHSYCLPVLKREGHRRALVAAATSGNARFFLGTDSAPHAVAAKQRDCGCAGIYNAPGAIGFYAEAFELAGALDRLEAFASHNGADFYGLARNSARITLEREAWPMPETLAFGSHRVVPMRAGQTVAWKLAGSTRD